MVWDGSDLDFVRHFFSAAREQQTEIMDLAHLPLTARSRRVLVLRQRASKLVNFLSAQQDAPSITVDELHKLLLIANTNLHHYFGHAPERADVASEHLHANRVALFTKAAKVNHHCAPNAMYSTQTPDGKIEYTAIREINKGDEITFSYLGEEGRTLSRDRRAELLADRDIKCECSRCLSPDWWRGLRCPKPGCEGLVFASPDAAGSDQWSCTRCGDDDVPALTERLQQEAAVRTALTRFTEQCQRFDEQPPDPEELRSIADTALHALAVTHSLLCQVAVALSRCCGSMRVAFQ
jgi:hypothetical protein